jgi:hypothetical protein
MGQLRMKNFFTGSSGGDVPPDSAETGAAKK